MSKAEYTESWRTALNSRWIPPLPPLAQVISCSIPKSHGSAEAASSAIPWIITGFIVLCLIPPETERSNSLLATKDTSYKPATSVENLPIIFFLATILVSRQRAWAQLPYAFHNEQHHRCRGNRLANEASRLASCSLCSRQAGIDASRPLASSPVLVCIPQQIHSLKCLLKTQKLYYIMAHVIHKMPYYNPHKSTITRGKQVLRTAGLINLEALLPL